MVDAYETIADAMIDNEREPLPVFAALVADWFPRQALQDALAWAQHDEADPLTSQAIQAALEVN